MVENRMKGQIDTLFAEPRPHVVDFAFDESVARVFPDMIRRSIPGYETVISHLAVIAEQYYQDDTTVYDLGCSLGAATLSVRSRLGNRCAGYVAVDSSAAMLAQCQENLVGKMNAPPVKCIQADIRETPLSEAGIVILNFTLQFLSPKERTPLLRRIFQSLVPGGVLILSEKLQSETLDDQQLVTHLYHRFKAANGYSELEISQKRTALEKVMQLDSPETQQSRLADAGFKQTLEWFRCFGFNSVVAIR